MRFPKSSEGMIFLPRASTPTHLASSPSHPKRILHHAFYASTKLYPASPPLLKPLFAFNLSSYFLPTHLPRYCSVKRLRTQGRPLIRNLLFFFQSYGIRLRHGHHTCGSILRLPLCTLRYNHIQFTPLSPISRRASHHCANHETLPKLLPSITYPPFMPTPRFRSEIAPDGPEVAWRRLLRTQSGTPCLHFYFLLFPSYGAFT